MSNIHSLQEKNKKTGSFYSRRRQRVIDQDSWAEIFKRLPIENLCRFRCVCKWWNSIISSPFFIKLHFTFNSSATPCNLKPYLSVNLGEYPDVNLSYTDLRDKSYAICRPPPPPLEEEEEEDNNVEHFRQELCLPLKAADRENGIKRFKFVDVVHGVICTYYSWVPSHDFWSPSLNSVILWNPTIHKFVAVPRLRLDGSFTAIGFGYDASKNDFKVVMMIPGSPGSKKPTRTWYHHVYSSRQGSWSSLPLTLATNIYLKPWIFNGGGVRNGCFVNGTIYWMQSFSRSYFINGNLNAREDEFSVLMFDCESEEFRRMHFPKSITWRSSAHHTVSVELLEYAGMLAALATMHGYWTNLKDLWVMEEHGASTSWKKLYTIPYKGHITIHDPSFEKMAPYGPNSQWNKTQRHYRLTQILSSHVYNESMFLMDHPKAQSCTKEEIKV